MNYPKIAFWDIDGVIANDSNRVHFALERKWADYFRPDRMAADTVWEIGRTSLLVAQEMGYTIAYLTGRREDRRTVTQQWLDDNGFPFGKLVMRRFDQHVPLANLKTNYLASLIGRGYEDVVLFDDDPEVIRLVQETLGVDRARHCTWHVKQKALVKAATA